ncbi:MAG: glycyl-radical enzyme activating protein [Terriglobia bacterium]
MAKNTLEGRVFDIQRFSIHDGPGIRTTVFLKGCPLRCLWCHNPEGMTAASLISFEPDKCLGCGECVRVCEQHAHEFIKQEIEGSAPIHAYHRERCLVCGNCTVVCGSRTLELVGRLMTVAEVMKEVRADQAFYKPSGGGLTLSGGEPLAQIDFSAALLSAAREEGIHCCVETAGYASWQRFQRVSPWVDLFLFDFKETDPARHAAYTGQSNEVILRNHYLLHESGARIQLQCPIIPGFNDREDHFAGIAALSRSLPNLSGVQLLPYHPLGKSKLERFGLAPRADLTDHPLDPVRFQSWIHWLRQQGVPLLNPNGSGPSQTASQIPLESR